jgi:hypothetical protein
MSLHCYLTKCYFDVKEPNKIPALGNQKEALLRCYLLHLHNGDDTVRRKEVFPGDSSTRATFSAIYRHGEE